MNTADRLFARVRSDPSGCLIWTGQINAEGYGVFQGRAAHRWLLERVYGRNAHLVTDHLCRVRACVRPSHLEFVTIGENTRRGFGARRVREIAAARTHCIHGHEFTEDNLYRYTSKAGKTSRMCKTCMRSNVGNVPKWWKAAYARRWRANARMRTLGGSVSILHGRDRPLITVEVFAGDDPDRLDRDCERALEAFLASIPSLRVPV